MPGQMMQNPSQGQQQDPVEADRQTNSVNLAAVMPADLLNKIGQKVCDEYKIDKQSREEWEKTNEFAMKLATQVVEEKNEPFPGASNIKFPTVAMASVQFAARAMPQLSRSV